MAYYQDVNKKKMSRQEHMRQDFDREEEGSRYNHHGKPHGEFHGDFHKPYGDKPHGDFHGEPRRPYGDKPYGDKPRGDFHGEPRRPYGDKPRGDFHGEPRRPYGDKPRGDFHGEGNRPMNDKPHFHEPQRPDERPAMPPMFDTPYTQEPENLLSGRNPIREALKSGRDIEKLLVAKGELSGSAREIVAMAREMKIPVQVVERTRLDEITRNHQGMLAFASAYQYSSVDEMLQEALDKGEQPFLIVLDGITDPHNLGAIIRTAACVGAHGVIVPERRAVGLTPAAVKASAGAVETIKVARVGNLTRTIEQLKKEGLWVYAADMSGEDYRKAQMETPMVLVIGSEGEGISRLVLEQADFIVKLPMWGGVESLNASVAAGVLMYAAVQQRE